MRKQQSILNDILCNIENLKIKIEYLFHQKNQNTIKIFDNHILENTNEQLIKINKSFENVFNLNKIENDSFISYKPNQQYSNSNDIYLNSKNKSF